MNREYFWRGMAGLVFLVLGGVNIYLFWLKNAAYDFAVEESHLDDKRIEQIRSFR